MRKIVVKDHSQRNKKFVVIGGIFLVVIMLFSTVGYSFMSMDKESKSDTAPFEYNGFYFIPSNGYFFTSIGDYDFAIKTDPRNLNGNLTNDTIKTFESYSQTPLYYNSYDNLAFNEIYNNFRQIILRKNEACMGETLTNASGDEEFVFITECDANKDLPIKDCSKDTSIIIINSEESKIIQKDNCLIISGNQEEILKVADEFILKAFGVLA